MTATEKERVPLADALRLAIRDSGVSYNELRRRTGVSQGQLSRFMTGARDLTLASASRIALVLGYELVRTGPALAGALAEPTPTTLQRHEEGLPPPVSASARGRGRRMDLEQARDVVDEARAGAGEKKAEKKPRGRPKKKR